MKPIFEYDNYRQYLSDYYTEQKAVKPFFSYRYIAEKVGFKSAGHFTQIIQGKANISIHLIESFARFLKLNRQEASYFQNLVLYCQAKNHEGRRRYFEKMLSLRGAPVKIVDPKNYALLSEWYITAVREILNFFPFDGDYDKLAKVVDPPISEEDARKAIEILKGLKLIERTVDGKYKLADAAISTGYDVNAVALNNHIVNSLRLAEKALDRCPKKQRNHSTISVSLSQQSFELIIEELRSFRKRILEIAQKDACPDRAYQFNFQFFPLSKLDEDNNNGA